MSKATEVAVGIMYREDGSVLLCQRSPSKSYPLQWEFPGGKHEEGETSSQTLKRELHEELGIIAEIGPVLHHQVAYYEDGGSFAVTYHRVDRWHGEIINRVFADICWVHPLEFIRYQILSGNREICQILLESLT